MAGGSTVRLRYIVLAGLSVLACLLVWFAWPYYQEYDENWVEEAAHHVVENDAALETLRRLANLHGYMDGHASGVLHLYGTMYWAMERNPQPFLELAKNGSARERAFVARISKDGKNYYAEWYGANPGEEGR